MVNLNSAVEKAKHSSFYRRILNALLDRMVPFNSPHKFRIMEIGDFHLKTLIPYRRKNLNHIKGLHACALATVSEFTTGFMLLSKLDAKKYRLIMKRLEMEYHYQGKVDAVATFSISEDWLKESIYDPLKEQESVVIPCEVKIFDIQNNHLTTGNVYWQIKDWQKVKTKVPT
jgi:acyl-coenzyme A thioesterase PaaI-like protein